jgi:hypothetical protein
MSMTLVEISGQKLWTMELRLASAWSLSSGAGSCSIASSEPAELTAAAAMFSPTLLRLRFRSGSSTAPRGFACTRLVLFRSGEVRAFVTAAAALLGAEEDRGFVAVSGEQGVNIDLGRGRM